MRAPQKSCSQKGGRRKYSVSSQLPTMPTGHQKEFRSPHWAPQPTSQNAFWCLPTGRLGLQLQQQVPAARFPVATKVAARLAVLPGSNGLHLGCMWPGAWTGAGSPHGGKIMTVLVFMGHNITSVGGSVVAVVFRGYGRLQHACCSFLFEGFCLFLLSLFSPVRYHSRICSGPWLIFMTPGGLCFQSHDNSSFYMFFRNVHIQDLIWGSLGNHECDRLGIANLVCLLWKQAPESGWPVNVPRVMELGPPFRSSKSPCHTLCSQPAIQASCWPLGFCFQLPVNCLITCVFL